MKKHTKLPLAIYQRAPFSKSVLPDVSRLFLHRFDQIPSVFYFRDFDGSTAIQKFESQFESEVEKKFYDKEIVSGIESTYICYLMKNPLMVVFFEGGALIWHLAQDKESYSAIYQFIESHQKESSAKDAKFSLLENESGDLVIKEREIQLPQLSISSHYNDDFLSIHVELITKLSEKNQKGIVLLHGLTGTGKTTYLKYLTSIIEKKFIFIPPHMVDALTNPHIISLLMKHTNSILILEDAEEIIMKRCPQGSKGVSTLLNLTDGLLSDCLNIQVICTFNTDLSDIDPALMRKGRLIARYEFKPLELVKAKKLAQMLNKNPDQISAVCTLADLYNLDKTDYSISKKAIGFR